MGGGKLEGVARGACGRVLSLPTLQRPSAFFRSLPFFCTLTHPLGTPSSAMSTCVCVNVCVDVHRACVCGKRRSSGTAFAASPVGRRGGTSERRRRRSAQDGRARSQAALKPDPVPRERVGGGGQAGAACAAVSVPPQAANRERERGRGHERAGREAPGKSGEGRALRCSLSPHPPTGVCFFLPNHTPPTSFTPTTPAPRLTPPGTRDLELDPSVEGGQEAGRAGAFWREGGGGGGSGAPAHTARRVVLSGFPLLLGAPRGVHAPRPPAPPPPGLAE